MINQHSSQYMDAQDGMRKGRPEMLVSNEAIKILDDDDDPNIGAELNSVSEKQLTVVGSRPLIQPESVIEQDDDYYDDIMEDGTNEAAGEEETGKHKKSATIDESIRSLS